MEETNKHERPVDQVDPIGEPYEGSIIRVAGFAPDELEACGRLPPSAVASFWAGMAHDGAVNDEADPWFLGIKSLLKLSDRVG